MAENMRIAVACYRDAVLQMARNAGVVRNVGFVEVVDRQLERVLVDEACRQWKTAEKARKAEEENEKARKTVQNLRNAVNIVGSVTSSHADTVQFISKITSCPRDQFVAELARNPTLYNS